MINLIWKILLAFFVLDVIRKRMEPRPVPAQPNPLDQNKTPQRDLTKEEEIEDIDTSLDEEEESPEEKEPEEKEDEEETEDEEEEEEKKVKKVKKEKKKKKKVPKKIILVRYCKQNYQKYLDQFKLDMIGNFTNVEIVEEEYPLPQFKKVASKFTMFTQMGISMFLFGGSKIKAYVPFIPGKLFEYCENNKWTVMIGNFVLHSFLNNYLKSSYAFEVSVEGVEIWSKLRMNSLPKVKDLAKIFVEKGIDVNYK